MALIQWVERNGPGRLGVMAKPGKQDELEDDLRKVKEEGVDELICLMTPDEVVEAHLESEREIAERAGIDYKSFPIPDHGTPMADRGTMDFLDARLHDLKQGKSVVFHCNSGRGRTTLMAASLLVMEGMEPDRAIQHVRGRRLVSVPDEKEQTQWVRQLSANFGRPVPEIPERQGPNFAKIALAVGAAALAVLGVWQWRRRAS